MGQFYLRHCTERAQGVFKWSPTFLANCFQVWCTHFVRIGNNVFSGSRTFCSEGIQILMDWQWTTYFITSSWMTRHGFSSGEHCTKELQACSNVTACHEKCTAVAWRIVNLQGASSQKVQYGFWPSTSASQLLGHPRSASQFLGHLRSASQLIDHTRSASQLLGHTKSVSHLLGHPRSASQFLGHPRSVSQLLGHTRSNSRTNHNMNFTMMRVLCGHSLKSSA